MILALDLSTKSSGYAIFEDSDLISYGCLTASSTDAIERIQKIIFNLEDKILNKYDIKEIIIEEVHPEKENTNQKNMRTHKVLMWLQAALEFLIHDKYSNISINYIFPSEWRKICGIRTGREIRREALKKEDIKFVKEKYNIEMNDDEADATCIGYAYLDKKNNRIDWE